jgi:hypothetical protein
LVYVDSGHVVVSPCWVELLNTEPLRQQAILGIRHVTAREGLQDQEQEGVGFAEFLPEQYDGRIVDLKFSDWGNILFNTTIATAIADRLVENSEIFMFGGDSLRKPKNPIPPAE